MFIIYFSISEFSKNRFGTRASIPDPMVDLDEQPVISLSHFYLLVISFRWHFWQNLILQFLWSFRLSREFHLYNLWDGTFDVIAMLFYVYFIAFFELLEFYFMCWCVCARVCVRLCFDLGFSRLLLSSHSVFYIAFRSCYFIALNIL